MPLFNWWGTWVTIGVVLIGLFVVEEYNRIVLSCEARGGSFVQKDAGWTASNRYAMPLRPNATKTVCDK